MKNSIKKFFSVTGFLVLSFLVPHPAKAALFSKIYVFGDSLSDVGRFHQFTEENFSVGIPIGPPYAQKFSNGPLWVEHFQESLGLTPDPSTNFALAGSTTGDINTTIPELPGVEQQVAGFLTGPPVDPNALYILWAGSNDYLGGAQTDPAIPVDNIEGYISSLYEVGARNFMIPELPDLGRLPNTLPPNPNSMFLSQLSLAHNMQLASTLSSLSVRLPNSNIIPLDIASLISDAINNPSEFEFTNVTDACLPTEPLGIPTGPPCVNPDQYLFWDGIHPTTRAHQFVGQLATQALSVPEPSATLALVTLGVVAVGWRLGKKS